MLEPFQYTSGPRTARITIVAEAWGEHEEREGKPLVGYSGAELFRMLGEAFPDIAPKEHALVCSMSGSPGLFAREREAWLTEASILLTNVFPLRPANNNIELLCGKREEVGKDYLLPPLRQGKYFLPQYFPHVERLAEELRLCQPNLIIALGNVPCWALLQSTKISALRGTVAPCVLVPGLKVIPTYHPAAILRNWSWRPIAVIDLMKARREALFHDIRRPERWVHVRPTLTELAVWRDRMAVAGRIAIDIETGGGLIKCIGFALSRSEAVVVDFYASGQPDNSYWSIQDERRAWDMVEEILCNEAEKVFQNGLFDLQYILKTGLKIKNCAQDTMLLHHSLYPELQKSLGFMGSYLTDEPAWKLMRLQKEELKRDE